MPGGLNDYQGVPLHVCRGTGMERHIAPQIRFLCPPEIARSTPLLNERRHRRVRIRMSGTPHVARGRFALAARRRRADRAALWQVRISGRGFRASPGRRPGGNDGDSRGAARGTRFR